MTPTYAGPFRNNWALLLYGLDSVQISTIYILKLDIKLWIGYTSRPHCSVEFPSVLASVLGDVGEGTTVAHSSLLPILHLSITGQTSYLLQDLRE